MDDTAFSRRRFWKSVVLLAIPIALQNLLVNSFSLIDTVMVSRLGDVDLSAAGMAGQWTYLLTMMLFGLCSGLSVFVSQYWGAGNRRDIRRMSGITLTLCLLAVLLFMLPALLAPRFILSLFNKTPAVIASGASYLSVVAWSYPAVALFNLLCTLLRSTESVTMPLAVSGITTVCNLILNYGLIFGRLGFPELGITGAALATCVSAWLGPLLLLLLLALRRHFLLREIAEYVRFTRAQIGEFARRVIPVLLNETLWGAGSFLSGMIYSNIGYEYAAAVTIYKSVDGVMFSLFIGLCTACGILVGKSVGSGQTERGFRESARFSVLMPALTAVTGLLIILLRDPLIQLFNLQDKLSAITVAAASSVLLIYAAEMPLRINGYLLIVGVFRPGGDTRMASVLDLGAQWLIALPVTYAAAFWLHLPFPAVFACMQLFEDCIKTPACFLYFFSRKWIRPVTPEGQAGAAAYFAARREQKRRTRRRPTSEEEPH